MALVYDLAEPVYAITRVCCGHMSCPQIPQQSSNTQLVHANLWNINGLKTLQQDK